MIVVNQPLLGNKSRGVVEKILFFEILRRAEILAEISG